VNRTRRSRSSSASTPLTPEKARRIETQMDQLLEVAARRGGAFVGPEKALAALELA